MDRIDSANTIDLGGGKNGFQDQNAVAGVPGTVVSAKFLNSVQEEIMAVIEAAGIEPSDDSWKQLNEAIQRISSGTVAEYNVPISQLNQIPFLPILSMTLTTPPASPMLGDCYIVPTGANGAWANKENQLAEYNGTDWRFITTPNGHGIGLPDGSFYIKIDGVYVLYQVFLQNVFDSRYTQPNSNVFLKKSDFSSKSLFQVNGYQILPNGLMLQWGSVSGQASSTANNVDWFFTKKVIFPLAFPTACMSFVLGSVSDVNGPSPISEFTELNDTSVSVILNCQNKDAIMSCCYLAIGY